MSISVKANHDLCVLYLISVFNQSTYISDYIIIISNGPSTCQCQYNNYYTNRNRTNIYLDCNTFKLPPVHHHQDEISSLISKSHAQFHPLPLPTPYKQIAGVGGDLSRRVSVCFVGGRVCGMKLKGVST